MQSLSNYVCGPMRLTFLRKSQLLGEYLATIVFGLKNVSFSTRQQNSLYVAIIFFNQKGGKPPSKIRIIFSLDLDIFNVFIRMFLILFKLTDD